ncbi:hypothetical protein J6590_054059 [Homalodisca vitripennis]|nr:hypothetical protein J6590_054059 [Homalodisca vitripennis]
MLLFMRYFFQESGRPVSPLANPSSHHTAAIVAYPYYTKLRLNSLRMKLSPSSSEKY